MFWIEGKVTPSRACSLILAGSQRGLWTAYTPVTSAAKLGMSSCALINLADLYCLADGKGVASTPGKRPLLQEGQFQAEWLLPRGDYKTMHATFNNERLRVLLPKA